MRSRFVVSVLSVGLMGSGAGVVSGQDYPNKPIRLITPAAGGGADFTARQIAQGISGPLGQPVIVENRGGALIQGELLSKTPPDGYGLVVSGSSLWVTPVLRKAPYDALDFSPITQIERSVYLIAVHPSVPVKSIKELIALAKARPGELNYGSTAIGGPPHIAAELFKSLAGVNMVLVPYKGDAAAITALISGEVQLVIFDSGLLAPHVKSGKLRALAVTSAQPSTLAPGLPTVAAAGLPGFEVTGSTALFAPGKTPAAIINRLHQEVVRFLNQPGVKQRFLNAGAETVGNSPAEFAAIIRSDIARTVKVIKDAGLKID